MPPRILIFVGLGGDGPRAIAGAACELVPPGSARPITLDPAAADAVVRRTGDRLAEHLALRPVAWELAVLARAADLLRERPDATLVFDVPAPGVLVRVLEAADLARARLDEARPPAGVSTLAAQRAKQAAPGLAELRLAATGGDLLRAPELTTVGLVGAHPASGDAAGRAGTVAVLAARTALTIAGVHVLPDVLRGAPDAAARTAWAAGGAAAAQADPAPVTTATPRGADLTLVLPDLPDDLRAVRSGTELALHGAGVTRRLKAPRSLGRLQPEGVEAAEGAVTVRFGPAPSSVGRGAA